MNMTFDLFGIAFVLLLMFTGLYLLGIPLVYILAMLFIIVLFLTTHAFFVIRYWYLFHRMRVFLVYSLLVGLIVFAAWQFFDIVKVSAATAGNILREDIATLRSDIYPIVQETMVKYLP